MKIVCMASPEYLVSIKLISLKTKFVEGVGLWNIQLIGMLHHSQKAELLKHSTNLSGLDSAEIFQALCSVAVNFGPVLRDIQQLQKLCW